MRSIYAEIREQTNLLHRVARSNIKERSDGVSGVDCGVFEVSNRVRPVLFGPRERQGVSHLPHLKVKALSIDRWSV